MSRFDKNARAVFSLATAFFKGNKKFNILMKKKSVIRNKYTLSLLILLLSLVLTDIILHKGMSRVILPESFTDQRSPHNFTPCEQTLLINGKKWNKAINTVQRIAQLPVDAAGFEMDVYFDTAKNYFQVYHDTAVYSNLNIESILKVYQTRKLTASIWLDFKNLSVENERKSLNYLMSLRQQYNLQSKLIVESSLPQCLQSFCDSGFFTSFYTPFFNPYLLSEKEEVQMIDSISSSLKKYPAAALSGYYFQYPL